MPPTVALTREYAQGIVGAGNVGGAADSGHGTRFEQWLALHTAAPQQARAPNPGPADPPNPGGGVGPSLGSPPGGIPCGDPGPGRNISYPEGSADGCPPMIPMPPGYVPPPGSSSCAPWFPQAPSRVPQTPNLQSQSCSSRIC